MANFLLSLEDFWQGGCTGMAFLPCVSLSFKSLLVSLFSHEKALIPLGAMKSKVFFF